MKNLTNTQRAVPTAKGTSTPKKPGDTSPATGAMSYQLGFLAGS